MKKTLLTLALLTSAYAHAGLTLNVTTTFKGEEATKTLTLEENQSVIVLRDNDVSVAIEAAKKDDAITIRCVVCQTLQDGQQLTQYVIAEEEQTVTSEEKAEFKCGCAEEESLIVVVTPQSEEESDAQ